MVEGAEAGPEGSKREGPEEPAEAAEAAEPAEAPEAAEAGDDKPKSYGTILEEEIFQGLSELKRPGRGLFMSGLSAGLDIGFSVLLMAVLLQLLGGDIHDPLTHVVVALMYPVGFVFVIIGRSELFTEHTALAVYPVLGGRAGVDRLARLWALVYVSNLAGAALFAFIVTRVTPGLGVAGAETYGTIAGKMVDDPWHVILMSALLAGWLMGLLSWVLSAAKETIARILLIVLVTAGIGVAGLHHCIVGTVEVLGGVFSGTQTWGEFGHFLLWATLGNAVGGVVFVAVVKYSHAVRGPFIPPRVLGEG